MLFAIDLTLSDKAEIALLNVHDRSLSDRSSEFKRLRPGQKRLKIKLVETGSVHRADPSVIRKPVATEGVEVPLDVFFKQSLISSP